MQENRQENYQKLIDERTQIAENLELRNLYKFISTLTSLVSDYFLSKTCSLNIKTWNFH